MNNLFGILSGLLGLHGILFFLNLKFRSYTEKLQTQINWKYSQFFQDEFLLGRYRLDLMSYHAQLDQRQVALNELFENLKSYEAMLHPNQTIKSSFKLVALDGGKIKCPPLHTNISVKKEEPQKSPVL